MASNSNNWESVLTEDDYREYEKILLQNLKRFAPNHISEGLSESNVSVYPSKNGETVFAVTIRRGKYKGDVGFPDARAQEYGSGERTRNDYNFPPTPGQTAAGNGRTGKYLIKPRKGKTFLAFPWQAADRNSLHWSRVSHWQRMKKEGTILSEVGLPSYAGETPNGNLLFNWVKHPGIYAYNSGKGYIKFSIEVSKSTIEERLGDDAENSMRYKIREIFSRPGGKNK